MISFAKLLAKRPENLLGHIQSLMAGVASTAVETDQRSVFQEQITKISGDVSDQMDDDSLNGKVTAVVGLLDQYNRSAEQRTQAQQRELRGIIASTTQTIAAISNSSKSGLDQMRSLESSLENASKVDDLRLLRHKLFACLTLVRNETVRMQMDSQTLIRSLSASVLRASSELTPGTDATTGLPTLTILQKDINTAISSGRTMAAAVIVLSDLAVINTRFGREGGDEVLRLTTDYISHTFSGLADVYRGHGASLILVCTNAQVDSSDFEQRTKEVARYPFQTSLVVDGKLKNLNVALTSMYQGLTSEDRADELFRKFDAFAARELETI